ncbi:MAG: hypothetical protein KatS3mg035_2115 [Bacteroidia bacterium]|nr:MAG: hypothetical protein KatS3mg035_2115 [Bacteroidia bacterium]
MKEEIQLPKKYIVLLIVIYVSIFISGIVFFTRKYLEYKEEIKVFIGKEVKGRIIALKDEGRGHYEISIKTFNDTINQSLGIAWHIENYDIQVGDSVSKEANSRIMIFYRTKGETFKEYLKYEIYE